MSLNIEKDISFNIEKPYLHITKIEENEKYNIYCDGSYIKLPHDCFACVGGVIVNEEEEIVGEFFGPLKTKDALGLPLLPRFELQAINLALSISKHLNMKCVTILNDSMTDVDKIKALGINSVDVKWIPRKDNLADCVVSYAKKIWKKEQDSVTYNIQKRQSLFNKIGDCKISIHSYSNKNRGHYFIAVTEGISILKHNFSSEPNHFGEINLIIDILNQGQVKGYSFVITQNLFDRLKNYASAKSQIKTLDIYEKMFTLIFDYPHSVSFESRGNNFKINHIDKALHKYVKSSFG